MPPKSLKELENQKPRLAVATARNSSGQTLPTNIRTSNLTLSNARQAALENASKLGRPNLVPSNTSANHLVHTQASGSVNTPVTTAMHALTHDSGSNRSAGSSQAAKGKCSMACYHCKQRAPRSGNGPYCCFSYWQLGECKSATVLAPKPGSFICQGYDNVYPEHHNGITAHGTCCIDGRYPDPK